MKDERQEGYLLRERILSMTDSEAMDWLYQKSEKFIRLMAYYRCAMMEVETKFNVLNEEYSLQHDRNPISSIRTRLKSPQSIKEKLQRKEVPLSIDAIEERLNDVAGVRVVCAFPKDV